MIKYVLLGYNDGEHTSTKRVKALNVQNAHEKAVKFVEKHEKVAVYPDFLNGGKFDEYTAYIAAFQMVKSVFTSIVKNGKPVERIHTETQRIISRECRVMCVRLGLEEVQKEGISYIFRKFDEFSQDTKDMVQTAVDSLFEGSIEGLEYDELYRNTYKALNAYVYGERKHADTCEYMAQIEIDGGAVVPVNKYVAKILKGGERYTPIDSGELDSETADKLGQTLAEASKHLTERQKEILRLTYFGYSEKQICDKLNIKSSETLYGHKTKYRKIYSAYIRENAPEFTELVNLAAVDKSFEKLGRTEEGKERKKASDKATQAARAKAYRERKKLERLMQEKL